jgi:hypothetical protein
LSCPLFHRWVLKVEQRPRQSVGVIPGAHGRPIRLGLHLRLAQ